MSLFVLDTDIVSLLQRGHPRVVSRCAARRPDELAITVISLEEQLSGWYNLLRKTKQPDELVTAYQSLIDSLLFLARLPILPTHSPGDRPLSTPGRAEVERRPDGPPNCCNRAREPGSPDHGRNVRDFARVLGLVLEDWTQ